MSRLRRSLWVKVGERPWKYAQKAGSTPSSNNKKGFGLNLTLFRVDVLAVRTKFSSCGSSFRHAPGHLTLFGRRHNTVARTSLRVSQPKIKKIYKKVLATASLLVSSTFCERLTRNFLLSVESFFLRSFGCFINCCLGHHLHVLFLPSYPFFLRQTSLPGVCPERFPFWPTSWVTFFKGFSLVPLPSPTHFLLFIRFSNSF